MTAGVQWMHDGMDSTQSGGGCLHLGEWGASSHTREDLISHEQDYEVHPERKVIHAEVRADSESSVPSLQD